MRGKLGKAAMQKIDTHYVLHHYVCDYDDDDSKLKGSPTFQFIQHSKVRSLARHQHTAPVTTTMGLLLA